MSESIYIHFAAYDNRKKFACDRILQVLAFEIEDLFDMSWPDMLFIQKAASKLLDRYVDIKYAKLSCIIADPEAGQFRDYEEYLNCLISVSLILVCKYYIDYYSHKCSSQRNSFIFSIDSRNLVLMEKDMLKVLDYELYKCLSGID